jgi:DNA-binding SARP family transcriptional activator/GAF domain-containing protein
MLDEAACRLGETSLRLLDTPAEERFDRLTRLVRSCLRVPFSLLTVLTPDRQWFKSAQGTLLSETPVEVSFCVQALRSGRTLVLDNLTSHPDHCQNPVVCGPPNLRFYAGVPLRAPNGEWVGTLCALDDRTRQVTPEELEALQDLAKVAETEISMTTWTSSEQSVLEQSERSLRGSLVDQETSAWSQPAILDIALRENERGLLHQRPLNVVLLKTDMGEPAQARQKAETLRRSLASYQSLGRLSGDEFLVVLPELSISACGELAQMLRASVEGKACVLPLKGSFTHRDALRDHLAAQFIQAGSEDVSVRSTASEGLSARCFGPFELNKGGDGPVAASRFRTSKTRLLLAYLLGCPGRKASAELLIEEFWPNCGDMESGRNSLRGALSTIRSLLRQEGTKREGEDPILRDGNFVALAPSLEISTDLDSFSQLCQSGNETVLKQALELYRGPYLEGDYEDWVLRRRDSYAEVYLETGKRLAQQAFARGDFSSSAQAVELALASAPERQDLVALLFRSWLKMGRPEAVNKRYKELECELRRDYGVEPSIELLELYHRAELGLTG